MAGQIDKTSSLMRLETFSDAVFAVAITIMVLELKPPEISAGVMQDRLDFSFLRPYLSKLSALAVSFGVIATMWVALIFNFRRATRATWQLIWLVILHLFFVCLVPWATAFVAENPALPQAFSVYGIVVTCAVATCAVVVRHLEALFPKHGEWVFRKDMAVVSILCLAVVLSFVTVYLGFVVFSSVLALYFMPTRFQERLFRRHYSTPEADAGSLPPER